jgi:hypothetical protein
MTTNSITNNQWKPQDFAPRAGLLGFLKTEENLGAKGAEFIKQQQALVGEHPDKVSATIEQVFKKAAGASRHEAWFTAASLINALGEDNLAKLTPGARKTLKEALPSDCYPDGRLGEAISRLELAENKVKQRAKEQEQLGNPQLPNTSRAPGFEPAKGPAAGPQVPPPQDK